jgi:hypothetical protein
MVSSTHDLGQSLEVAGAGVIQAEQEEQKRVHDRTHASECIASADPRELTFESKIDRGSCCVVPMATRLPPFERISLPVPPRFGTRSSRATEYRRLLGQCGRQSGAGAAVTSFSSKPPAAVGRVTCAIDPSMLRGGFQELDVEARHGDHGCGHHQNDHRKRQSTSHTTLIFATGDVS